MTSPLSADEIFLSDETKSFKSFAGRALTPLLQEMRSNIDHTESLIALMLGLCLIDRVVEGPEEMAAFVEHVKSSRIIGSALNGMPAALAIIEDQRP
ncbi:MAG: hypothetical protein QM645_14165 [Asticcacaulis sp.]